MAIYIVKVMISGNALPVIYTYDHANSSFTVTNPLVTNTTKFLDYVKHLLNSVAEAEANNIAKIEIEKL